MEKLSEEIVPSRRGIVKKIGWLAILAPLFARAKPPKLQEPATSKLATPKSDEVFLLTEDGKLVKVDARHVAGSNQVATHDEVKNWIKRTS
ncbi:MAG: hypothetical protein FGM61_02555 [Sediminibacterium sp.]|nr:hypothetical protein [Sediminibacterium sp.]